MSIITAQINFSKGNDRHNLHSKSKKEHILTQSISNNIITGKIKQYFKNNSNSYFYNFIDFCHVVVNVFVTAILCNIVS